MKTLRYCRFIIHLLRAALTLAILFPWIDNVSRDFHIQKWSRRLFEILNIAINIEGDMEIPQGGAFYVANHISWLDIHLIHTWRSLHFVAKSEVASWPLLGWFADRLNTIYIQREKLSSAKVVVKVIAARMKEGDQVCVFPEGTTSTGEGVLEFRSNLFQAVIDTQVPCISIAILYKNAQTGLKTDIPAYIGDMTIIDSIKRVLGGENINATLIVKRVHADDCDRKTMAKKAWESIQLSVNT